MIKVFTSIIFILITQNNSNSNPVRLEKKESKSKFEVFCERICPYVIIACVIIICALLFVALVKYGHAITGTESNQYYYHLTE